VITGMGCVTPLGVGTEHVWTRLLRGDCAVQAFEFPEDKLKAYATAPKLQLPCRVAAPIPRGSPTTSPGAFDVTACVPAALRSSTAEFVHFAWVAAQEAVTAARLPESATPQERMGVAIGSGVGSLHDIASSAMTLRDRGSSRISPYFIPKILSNMVCTAMNRLSRH
jgi:3-oxoacyl-[acyl-carrier-protein] synthase II